MFAECLLNKQKYIWSYLENDSEGTRSSIDFKYFAFLFKLCYSPNHL